jgi:hypothetical protein
LKVKYYIQEGETLLDVAMSQYGDVAELFTILEDNPELRDVNSNLQAGDFVWIRQDVPGNDIINYYKRNKVEVVSGTEALEAAFDPEGFDCGFEGGVC